MAIFNIFRVPKPQRYKYIPRYYDPDKEERELALRQLEEMQGGDPEAMKARITSGLRRRYRADQTYRKSQMRRSNFRLLIIIIALLIFAYLALVEYLPQIIRSLE